MILPGGEREEVEGTGGGSGGGRDTKEGVVILPGGDLDENETGGVGETAANGSRRGESDGKGDEGE